jgi:GNAT superfamily N-acetyltransferase
MKRTRIGASSRVNRPAAPRVVASFDSPSGDHCVDIFLRADGTFGFEEYRRDAEDMRGWFSLHRYAGLAFATDRDALAEARAKVAWMSEYQGRPMMSSMTIRIAESDADLERVAPVLLELRSTYDRARLLAQVKAQMAHGYRIAYLEEQGEVLCAAGFVVGSKLAWGKHLYVDDLVTAERHRSTGAGAKMIDWLKAHARSLGCGQLHLDSGVQRFPAHRFYLRQGFNIASHHFSMTDLKP